MIMENLNKLKTRDVVVGGTSDLDHTIEGQHDNGRDWVGGTMDILNISANDQVFFIHHAFIDYIWEKFRIKQQFLFIGPEKDYPAVVKVVKGDNPYDLRPFHQPNRTMNCFSWLSNIDGYLNLFTNTLYEYEDSPKCPDCGHSKWLSCNDKIHKCIVRVNDKKSLTGGFVDGIVIWSVVGTIVWLILISLVTYKEVKVGIARN